MHDGRLWQALWHSRNERPGSNPYGAWAEIGEPVATAYGEATRWTSTAVYEAGALVERDGMVWRASWWNRGVQPGGQSGPWQLLGPVGGA